VLQQVRELRCLNGGELKVQERQPCPQLVKVFRGKQRCMLFNVLGD
jgi:hypothetical protein